MSTTALLSQDPIERVERESFGAMFRQVVRVRMWFALPSLALIGLFLWAEPALWRRLVLGCGLLVSWSYFTFEYLRTSRQSQPRLWMPNLPVVVLLQFLVVLSTGALESPVVPVYMAMLLLVSIFRPPVVAVRAAILSACLVAVLWALQVGTLDLMPAMFGGGPRAAPSLVLLTARAVFAALTGFVAVMLGGGLRQTYQGLVQRIFEARSDVLQANAEQLRAMTLLSGEIAHELKNPLASVKGLAQLLARDLSGRDAERLAVLRREVDRMQEILETFLHFSRPLVPLALEAVKLEALAEGVLALHEGLAEQRGVRLVLSGAGLARCDPRKVRQVLINLVQNALDAAPRGTAVALRAGPSWVEVADEGPGWPEGDVARLFEPGVTTKAEGHGLGLTIARGLARQHGGELELIRRAEGGALARLVLP